MIKPRDFLTCFLSGFLFISFCPSSAYSAIYRYVDSDGTIHFTNVPNDSVFRFYRAELIGIDSITECVKHYGELFRIEAALLHAIIKVESNFNPKAVSHKGARGLMQLLPGTAKDMDVKNPLSVEESIYGGSRYLRGLLDRFGGNLDLALAAYNAGPSKVEKYGGIPPYEETQNYVKRVKKYLNYYRKNKDALL